MLSVDDREPKDRVRRLTMLLGDAVRVERRTYGDYGFEGEDGSPSLVVEVKTVGSLLSSVRAGVADGRSVLESEVARLQDLDCGVRLVVIGETWRTSSGKLAVANLHAGGRQETGWTYTAYARVLDNVADHGIPVLQLANEDAFADWCRARLAMRSRERSIRARQVFAYRDADAPPLRLLASLPGVDTTKARALWARFGTPRAALAADETALRTVPGIGGVTARSIAAVLDQRNGSEEA